MKWFSLRALIFGAMIALLLWGSVIAQDGIVSIYKVGGLKGGTSVTAGANVRFLIRYNNTTGEKCDISNGFKLSSPDGAVWDSTTIDSIGSINDGGTPGDPTDDYANYFIPYFDITFSMGEFSCDGVDGDTVGVLAAGNPNKAAKQMPAGYNDSVFAITAWFDGKIASAGKHICIDSAFFSNGGTWKWVTKSLLDKFPTWVGLAGQPYSDGVGVDRLGSGYCFDIYSAGIQLSVDSLGFSQQIGGASPPAQSFTVSSNGDAFGDHPSFTLVENSPWIVKSPSSGSTPKAISVTINSVGLVAGVYVDSIKVDAPTAYNSPKWVKISLTLIDQPPTIFASKSSFSFNGLTGGANPASQTFFIKNSGGQTLNWTITKSSAWLDATPAAGADSNTVTVSVNTASLGVGDHFDTLVISATPATNSPVKIPVKLTLGSSLPFIQSDSAVYHVIVDPPDAPPARVIQIFNGGIGSMTFTLSENSVHLFTVSPMSGTAPQAVTVGFKVLEGIEGANYFDTLWVTSPEAVNSPYPIVFHFLIRNIPPILAASKDTIRFVTYDCEGFPSTNSVPPVGVDSFLVYDTSESVEIVHDTAFIIKGSSLCSLNRLSGEMSALFIATAQHPVLAPGVYYDTILVGAYFAYNSPETVIVKYTRFGTGTDPHLLLSRTAFEIPHQEQTGPVGITLNVTNSDYGCLPWYVSESIPWMVPQTDSGNVPGLFSAVLQIDAFTLGTYLDSFYVTSPIALNSPQLVKIKLKIWKLRGDCNWDGFINLPDLSWLIAYLLTGSPLPQPEYKVGDTNCSGLVDLSDLSLLIAYLINHATICGNP